MNPNEVVLYGEGFFLTAEGHSPDPLNPNLDQAEETIRHTLNQFRSIIRKDVTYDVEYAGKDYVLTRDHDTLILV